MGPTVSFPPTQRPFETTAKNKFRGAQCSGVGMSAEFLTIPRRWKTNGIELPNKPERGKLYLRYERILQ